MIFYTSDGGVCQNIFALEGSVLPKTFVWAGVSGMTAVVLWFVFNLVVKGELDEEGQAFLMQQADGISILWSGYSAVLGLLVVFRNNNAYSRFWEGATLVNQVRGEWLNAMSSLISFCSRDGDNRQKCQNFQYLLVRLMSLLHASALQSVCELDEENLDVLDLDGIDDDSLSFLEDSHDRCETLMQWIQRTIVQVERENLFEVAPPVLSRCFQELSRGVVNLHNLRKIRDIPLPFPYMQTMLYMMVIHSVLTPIIASLFVRSPWWAGILSFFVSSALWSIHYIAAEIDQPFGEDPNDLPLVEIQQQFNLSLLGLLEPQAMAPPAMVQSCKPHVKTFAARRTMRFSASAAPTHHRLSIDRGSIKAIGARQSGMLRRQQSQARSLGSDDFTRQGSPKAFNAGIENVQAAEVSLNGALNDRASDLAAAATRKLSSSPGIANSSEDAAAALRTLQKHCVQSSELDATTRASCHTEFIELGEVESITQMQTQGWSASRADTTYHEPSGRHEPLDITNGGGDHGLEEGEQSFFRAVV